MSFNSQNREHKKIPLARSDFESWLKLNRPHLRAYRNSSDGKLGYYSSNMGIAESFRGFNSWDEAKQYLVNHS